MRFPRKLKKRLKSDRGYYWKKMAEAQYRIDVAWMKIRGIIDSYEPVGDVHKDQT